jgi:hypothetical protein
MTDARTVDVCLKNKRAALCEWFFCFFGGEEEKDCAALRSPYSFATLTGMLPPAFHSSSNSFSKSSNTVCPFKKQKSRSV